MILTLKFKSSTVLSIKKFKRLTDLLASENINIKKTCLSKDHKTLQNSKEKINIKKHMRAELDLLANMA